MSQSPARKRLLIGLAVAIVALLVAGTDVWAIRHFGANARSEERRVGKEC